MQFTVKQKIISGSAGVLLVGLLSMLVIYGALRTARKAMHEVAEVEEPTSAAAYEMEINVIGTGLGVLKYLDTGDPQYRDRVEKDEADFVRFKARYDELAETPAGKELGNKVGALFGEFVQLGRVLMDQRDERETLFRAIAENFEVIDGILDEEIQENLDEAGPDGQEKVLEAAAMEGDIAEVGTWLGNYLRVATPVYRERIFNNARDFRAHLAEFKNLRLSSTEIQRTERLEKIFSRTFSMIQKDLALHDELQVEVARFLVLREQMDYVLDEEIQALTMKDLVASKQKAEEAHVNVIWSISLLLPVFLLLGLGTARVLIRDYTQRKRAEEEIRRLNQELEQRVVDVVERTEELRESEKQLRQAQKMEAVGRLAGGVAHDFNNLLMVMRGYCELLLNRLAANDPLRRNAEEIQKAAERATGLTQQLLAFSHQQVLQPRVLDLNAVVTEVEKMLRRVIGEDIELAATLDLALGRVKADPGQIEQIILNLAVNARDAMSQGGRLTLKTSNVTLDQAYVRQHRGARPGPHLLLAVSDTGTGMDAETQSHIFEPFFTTKSAGKGTGLGLSTVYGIVKQSGGYIGVESAPGRGTTFEIYLPLVEEAAAGGKLRPALLAPRPGGTETILVVEDEMSVRRLTGEFLASNGYRVLEAQDGGEALQVCEKHRGPIHLLVTDVVMPGMSGRDLAVRLAGQRPEMKVIYMSGYTDDTIVQHGVLEEGILFLQKPFSLDELASVVREGLEVGRGNNLPQ